VLINGAWLSLGGSKKKQQRKIALSTSSAKGEVLHAMARFFCGAAIASGWCKVLKAVQGFNLTVI
jgi:hypothetical protein